MKAWAYYNEIDDFAADWLENLIRAGHIAPGVVDRRSVVDVRAHELREFTQCHFFAGIGVWSYALRRAGWPDDRPVWTGSCPCQPFSAAGKGEGHEDERHLWPAWFGLIGESRPVRVFGEQVADGDGYAWLDLVGHDLEGVGYALGAVCPAACGVGAPEERQRLYFVVDTEHARLEGHGGDVGGGGESRRVASRSAGPARPAGGAGLVGHTRASGRGAVNGFWAGADWVWCRDPGGPCWRPVEPGTFPLVNGAAGRVGRLRAYGNAIIAPLAEEFIRAYCAERGL